MKPICPNPKCNSKEIKEIDQANCLENDKSVSYYGDSEPKAFECKQCGHRWDNKK